MNQKQLADPKAKLAKQPHASKRAYQPPPSRQNSAPAAKSPQKKP